VKARRHPGALATASAALLCLACSGLLRVAPAHAQASVPLDQLRRPSEVPLPAPEAVRPAPRIEVPALPTVPQPRLSEGIHFRARGFRFEGNTVVAEAELQALAAPYVGRELGNAELDALRLAITRRYVEAGYINSGAVLPDQDVQDGIVVFRVVEGRLAEIVLGGPHRYDPAFLRDRIALGAPEVLDINRLQEHLQVLLQDPLIERIRAELAPGAALGEAVLRADVVSAPTFLGSIAASNERSPSVGADQIEAFLAARNLLGRGDVLTLRPAFTQGVNDYAASYVLPLTPGGTALQLRAERTRSRIVESPLDELDIYARSRSYELGLTHPLVALPRTSLNLSGWFARRETRSYFLGEPSPFIPGAPDGRTKLSILRLALEGVDRSPERVAAARVQLSQGIDAFDATVSGRGTPDSRFTAVLAQLQWVQRVQENRSYFVARAEVQQANDLLPGSERYAIGGADSVRGYRKELIVRDSGWFGSIEYRHLLGHLPWSAHDAVAAEGPLHLALFTDAGRGWNHSSPAAALRIYSIGAGLRWEPAPGMDWQVYYGKALKDVDTPTRTLQDHGVHLRFAYTRAF